MRLAGKTIILTGAAGGIGLPFACRLLDEGASVVLTDIRTNAEVQALVGNNSRAVFTQADICSENDTENLVASAISRFGHIDVLINNAGLFPSLARQPLEQLTREDWEEVLRVNVIGTFNCIRAVVPEMKICKRGKVINVASNAVHKGLACLLHYVASKGAIMAMTRALAVELGAYGISVNAIAPGYVLHSETAKTDHSRNQQVIAKRALQRTEIPEDLLGTIAFLSSDDSDFMTGQTLVIDGGEVFS